MTDPDAESERAAVLAYIDRLRDVMHESGNHRQATYLAILIHDIGNGAHLDTAPDLRCSARTTAPEGDPSP